ncbi:MAG: hypothetical protein M0T74_15205 [Desulfitobacterium hafniense]|nr:hypothetical protein [Desulfitobacterium hafniense]
MNIKDKYGPSWNEFNKLLFNEKVTNYFDQLYKQIRNLYSEVGAPNGESESDMWEWCKEQIFLSRGRAIKVDDNFDSRKGNINV